MRKGEQQVIAASNSDLRNNRLGLMSADQLKHLQEQIDHFQLRTAQLFQAECRPGRDHLPWPL